MPQTTTTIELSTEEMVEYRKLDARLGMFLAGAQAMGEHVKRMKLDELIAARPILVAIPEKEETNG
jgi:hypothetical protein